MVFEEISINKDLEPSNKVALIDGDSLIYTSCYKAQVGSQEFEEALFFFQESIQYIKKRTGVEKVEIYLTPKENNNFRYFIYPSYKSSRKKEEPPKYLQELKKKLVESYGNIFFCYGYEPDDQVVFLKDLKADEYILCANDKDVLYSCPGVHYNFSKDLFIEVSKEQSIRWPFFQTLIGDSTDCIPGIPGIGPKKGEKLLRDSLDIKELWESVKESYFSFHLKEKDALLNMRLVNMHQLWYGKIHLWTIDQALLERNFIQSNSLSLV